MGFLQQALARFSHLLAAWAPPEEDGSSDTGHDGEPAFLYTLSFSFFDIIQPVESIINFPNDVIENKESYVTMLQIAENAAYIRDSRFCLLFKGIRVI